MPAAISTRARAEAARMARPIRSRIEVRATTSRIDAVAGAPDCLDEGLAEGCVDLLAQAVDEDFDEVRFRFAVEVPDVFGDHRLAQAAGVPHQVFEGGRTRGEI